MAPVAGARGIAGQIGADAAVGGRGYGVCFATNQARPDRKRGGEGKEHNE